MMNTYRAKEQTVKNVSSLFLWIVLGVLLFASCASDPDTPQQQPNNAPSQAPKVLIPTVAVPAEWAPSLEQVQEDLEEGIATQSNQSQQALNKASQNLADLADARLFISYVLLMQKLDEKSRAELLKEQKLWLTQRATSARAAVVSKGGSLGPLEYANAFADMTKKRLAELKARLAQ